MGDDRWAMTDDRWPMTKRHQRVGHRPSAIGHSRERSPGRVSDRENVARRASGALRNGAGAGIVQLSARTKGFPFVLTGMKGWMETWETRSMPDNDPKPKGAPHGP